MTSNAVTDVFVTHTHSVMENCVGLTLCSDQNSCVHLQGCLWQKMNMFTSTARQ